MKRDRVFMRLRVVGWEDVAFGRVVCASWRSEVCNDVIYCSSFVTARRMSAAPAAGRGMTIS